MTKSKSEELVNESLEQNLEKFREKLNKLLDDNQIELAAMVFKFKDLDEPQIQRKGHFYDNAALMNQVLNAYRAKAAVDLGLQ